jgi:hypothetical protein
MEQKNLAGIFQFRLVPAAGRRRSLAAENSFAGSSASTRNMARMFKNVGH